MFVAEVFVPAAVRGEWQRAPPCWLIMCCLMSQWVLSFPFQLRFLFASYPQIMGKVLGIVYRTLATHITEKAGYNKQTAQTGAVTLIQLKTSYRDGTTGDRRSHVIFEPLDFIARLAALVPKPRVNLTRFHGVFVRGGPPPNSRHRDNNTSLTK
jgi:hypothetical protein